ncbi:MAG: hypothetical protein F6K11_34690 [Leptolyngbya sp. SIO3F4]|nr:hypothetical protein [Leptolyngbya sp. SIO3F4]
MVNRCLSGAILTLISGSGFAASSIAQSYPDCPPPAKDEYLLFVRADETASRERTVSVLPVDTPTLVCDYLGDTVVRAGGFNSLEVANSWALYLNDIEQLDTVVVESITAAATVSEDIAGTESEPEQLPQYEPTLLGGGVAVLVDYQQNPDIGRELAQQGNVGLAVYLQRPYLLVLHTEDSSAAATRLQQLVDNGLKSFLVDGQQVIRLTEAIR